MATWKKVVTESGSGEISQNTTGQAASLSALLVTTKGGTGLGSYTKGDILYASASNTLSKLAVGSIGTVLKVGLNDSLAWGTTAAGTVTAVTVGDGLDVSSGTTTPNITLDLSELADGTDAISGSADEIIYLDNGTQKRKAFDELNLAEFDNSTSGFTTNSGDINDFDLRTNSYTLNNATRHFVTSGSVAMEILGGTGCVTSNVNGVVTVNAHTASASTAGVVELATTVETGTGTDASRAVTPDGLKDGYPGSTNVTTLGTIATGTWEGTTVAVAQGGTGVTTSTGSGNNVLSASPTFTGTVGAAAITTTGDLTVGGTLISTETEILKIEDSTLVVNSGVGASTAVDGGMLIERGDSHAATDGMVGTAGNNVGIFWDESAGYFAFSSAASDTAFSPVAYMPLATSSTDAAPTNADIGPLGSIHVKTDTQAAYIRTN